MKKYDIHIHTSYSKCSNNPIEKIVETAKKRGLNGIAITDHNTIEGAVKLKELNKDKNFEVIVGEEVETEIGHVLVYCLKKRTNPGKFEDVLKEAKKQKAIVVLAHPYNIVSSKIAKLFHIKSIRDNLSFKDEKIVKKFDAIEGFNSRSLLKKENQLAQNLAKKFNKPIIAGSDAHFLNEIGTAYVEFDDNLTLKKAVLKNKISFRHKKKSILFIFYNRFKSFLKKEMKLSI